MGMFADVMAKVSPSSHSAIAGARIAVNRRERPGCLDQAPTEKRLGALAEPIAIAWFTGKRRCRWTTSKPFRALGHRPRSAASRP